MKKTLYGISMSIVMTLSLLTTTYALEEPTPPTQQEFNSNTEIDSYNSQVTEYNQKVDEYNNAVDVEYENELSSVTEQNVAIDKHNQEEENRFNEETARNEQAIQDAEEQNALIDQQNQQREQEVNAINEAKTAAYEAELEQYNLDYENYETDLAKYEKDKKIEDQILALGYESVEDYNNKINQRYNIPAINSITENATAAVVPIESTYTIEKSTSESGRMIPIHIEHNFMGTDISYVIDFEIDANDTIIMNGIAAIGKAIVEGSCMFYYNTDEAHSMGYWANSDSYLAINPTATSDTQWINGDTHVVTYKDSTNEYQWYFEDVYMVYNYWWQALRTYKTYDVPVLPTEPTEPVLELEEFIPIEHVSPELIDVLPKDIWDNLPLPIKKQYLAHMDLLPRLPEPIVEPEPEVVPTVVPVPFTPEPEQPQASNPPKVVNAPVEIMEPSTPTTVSEGYWALINLIIVFVSIVIAVVLFIMWLINHRKNKDEEEENKEYEIKHRTVLRIISLIIAIGLLILFLLTENVKLPMRLVDFWTIPMAIVLLVQIILMIFSKKKKVEKSEK